MPQKKNLTVLENFKARPAVLLGALSTAIASLRGTPFGHSQEVSVEANRWIWDAMREFNGMLPVSKLLVLSVSAKRDRMAELTRANFATATSLADLLTTHHDISFRQAHHLVGHYVRLVMEGMDNQEALRTAAVEELKRIPEGIEKVLREVLDPAAAIEALSVGPSRSESERLIHEGKNRLEKEEQTLGALRRRLEGAARILSARCEELMHPAHGENVQ